LFSPRVFTVQEKLQFLQLADFLYKLQAIIRVCESVFVSLFGVGWYCAVGGVMGSVEKYWGTETKKTAF
jgi:hypothetical protein